jgi:hypothetical protein
MKRQEAGEELHNSYSSPSIIRIVKSRRMRWAGHVARMGRRGMHTGYWWESQKERDHWEAQDAGGWTILKWILETGWHGVDWMDMTQDRDKWRALVNTVLSLRVPKNSGKF